MEQPCLLQILKNLLEEISLLMPQQPGKVIGKVLCDVLLRIKKCVIQTKQNQRKAMINEIYVSTVRRI